MQTFDPDKLKENAVTSIRLGIEDFEKSQAPGEQGGDPARALSAARNLFSGVLLLFKYKIAICVEDPDDALQLIFDTNEVLPHRNDAGGVEWRPGKLRKTTIDVGTIRKRFETFEIEMDWTAIDKLQACRNHLEHLHPANSLGEIAEFVAELFPVLGDFIEKQLNAQPADLLGTAWPIMLRHHAFFSRTLAEGDSQWEGAGVPTGMKPWRKACKCEQCGSSLLRPNAEDLDERQTVESNDETFRYQCFSCGYVDLIGPLMIDALDTANTPYRHYKDGGDPTVETCLECGHDTFVVGEQQCYWCGTELDYKKCTICEEALGQDDQDNGGLCGYHAHAYEKHMRDD
nr:hypothetical protein [uncultured Cupriavidus sp.]